MRESDGKRNGRARNAELGNGNGQFIEGWETKTLGEVCALRPPKQEVRRRLADTELVSFLPMGDLGIRQQRIVVKRSQALADVYSGYTYFANGDVLLAKITPCFQNGKLGIARDLANGVGFGSTEFFVLRCADEIIPEYLFYFLSRDSFIRDGVARMGGAVGQQRVPPEFVLGERMPVPPLPEQRRIVAILDEAFAGIATARANAERNLRNARALFESHLEGVFSRRGEGWVERRLGDIAKTQYGLSKAMNTDREGFKIFRMGEIQDGGLHDTGEMKYVNIDSTEFRKYKLNIGDVLFNRTNSYELVGKTGIFNLKGDYCFASYLIRVLLDTSIMRPEFLNYFMNSDHFQQSVKRKASKSINQANINATILSNELIRFPESHDEQHATVIQLNSLREQTQNLETLYQRKLAALDELKKSLLDRAFSGRL